jgi:hypothetical protein
MNKKFEKSRRKILREEYEQTKPITKTNKQIIL